MWVVDLRGVLDDPSNVFSVTLAEVVEHSKTEHSQAFSLFFHGPLDRFMPQGIPTSLRTQSWENLGFSWSLPVKTKRLSSMKPLSIIYFDRPLPKRPTYECPPAGASLTKYLTEEKSAWQNRSWVGNPHHVFVFAPRGWALCNGQHLLPINQNQALFSLLGTTFGGDGRVNFALPDLRGPPTHSCGQRPHAGRTWW